MRRPLLRAPIRYQISSCQRWQHLRQRPISLQTMSRPRRPAALPLQDGVSASCAVVHGGPWPSALDFLAARLPVLHRDEWAKRFARGEVLDAQGAALAASAPCREGQRLFYYRRLEAEPAAPEAPRVLHQDDTLLVADKPHFLPVTPAGRYVQQTLLTRLKRATGIETLTPIHRIDRDEAVIRQLIELEAAFWHCVQARKAPPADGSASAQRALQALYAQDNGQTLDFTQDTEMGSTFSDLQAIRQRIEDFERQEAQLRQRIEQRMGEASKAVFETGEVTYRKAKDSVVLDSKRLLAEQPALKDAFPLVRPGVRRFLVRGHSEAAVD